MHECGVITVSLDPRFHCTQVYFRNIYYRAENDMLLDHYPNFRDHIILECKSAHSLSSNGIYLPRPGKYEN